MKKVAKFAYVAADRREEFFKWHGDSVFPADIYYDSASGTMWIVEKEKPRGIKKLIANIKKL